MVRILEKKGLITRTPDARNRHIRRISLTPAGEAVLSRCDVLIDQLETRMLDPLRPADVAALREALDACMRSLADPARRFLH